MPVLEEVLMLGVIEQRLPFFFVAEVELHLDREVKFLDVSINILITNDVENLFERANRVLSSEN